MWSYEGTTGPAHWADMDPEWAANVGERQSPIDLPSQVSGGYATLEIDYETAAAEVSFARHSLRLDVEGEQSIRFNGVRHDLDHIHFHAPSEHTVDGIPADAEAHFVHRDTYGRLLVLGVFVEEGPAHPGIDRLLAEPSSFDPSTLLPTSLGRFWTYQGSLTTPPLSEGVTWVIFADRLRASADGLAHVERICDGNARPTQPLNRRRVEVVIT